MAKRTLFGTDGVRGTANREPMTADTALRIGMAAGHLLRNGDHRHTVVIGKDTRLSGYMLEPALAAGFISVGMDVVLLGPLPTPAVAMLTRSLRADLGVMITASHNPFQDNGIKLFGPDGYKLSDAQEATIEALLDNGLEGQRAGPTALGKARRLDDCNGRYVEFVKSTFPRGRRLEGLRIVVDCAHGAAYRVAPKVLWELGATIVPIGVTPDGTNINKDCGSLHSRVMCETVVREGADLGVALDGDADRVVLCDEKGALVDGDQLLALIGRNWKRAGTLQGGGVVATVMSNLGLERFLKGEGLALARTPVGDRYVVEHMRAEGYNLGGEQSGHIVMSDFGTTGDGLMAALQVLSTLVGEDRPASEVLDVFTPLPQLLRNVRVAGHDPRAILADPQVARAVSAGEGRLNGGGRLLIRKSGTEPLIRVMAEGEDEALVAQVVGDICAVIETASQ
ncbi:phosphoglucosamine mutase [Rhodospirillum rubrum]|uniref:phosphoglucosamine mutase n=1 Tax=Rhodospirillum rubrum TaxID=1085 RepID=UPI00190482E1|nr:phosphoglucosamine mutase [Rhodospirillum rubrum]MBK1664860.1 phosphoglucosamine mutase [Rhodospirillum rubrum]MBK1676293.1 phosphoglucosamine mutase [Rhodospirillum rubrum]